MTHSKKTLPSCRLIRSPSNFMRRKNINFDSVLGSSWELPGSSQKLSPKSKKTRKVDMTAAPEASGSFLEAFWKSYEQKPKS